jgi:hypothetical protein
VHDRRDLFQPWAERYTMLDQQFKIQQRGY